HVGDKVEWIGHPRHRGSIQWWGVLPADTVDRMADDASFRRKQLPAVSSIHTWHHEALTHHVLLHHLSTLHLRGSGRRWRFLGINRARPDQGGQDRRGGGRCGMPYSEQFHLQRAHASSSFAIYRLLGSRH